MCVNDRCCCCSLLIKLIQDKVKVTKEVVELRHPPDSKGQGGEEAKFEVKNNTAFGTRKRGGEVGS